MIFRMFDAKEQAFIEPYRMQPQGAAQAKPRGGEGPCL